VYTFNIGGVPQHTVTDDSFDTDAEQIAAIETALTNFGYAADEFNVSKLPFTGATSPVRFSIQYPKFADAQFLNQDLPNFTVTSTGQVGVTTNNVSPLIDDGNGNMIANDAAIPFNIDSNSRTDPFAGFREQGIYSFLPEGSFDETEGFRATGAVVRNPGTGGIPEQLFGAPTPRPMDAYSLRVFLNKATDADGLDVTITIPDAVSADPPLQGEKNEYFLLFGTPQPATGERFDPDLILFSGGHSITVATQAVVGNSAPVLTIDTAGSVTESDTVTTLTDTGTLSVTDADTGDTFTVSAVYNMDAALNVNGTLTQAQIDAISSTTSNFTVTNTGWTYNVANSDIAFLDAGQNITLSFDVTATDSSGAANNFDTETVTIVINGIDDPNRAPMASTIDETFNEDQAPDTVNLLDPASVSDPDGDTLSVVPGSVTQVGSDNAGGITVDEGNGVLNVNPQFYGFLNDGQRVDVTYTYNITDGEATISNTAIVRITGITDSVANTRPTITVTNGSVTEDGAVSTSGTITVGDADAGDILTVSENTANRSAAYSGGMLDATLRDTLQNGFSVTGNTQWNYTVNNSLIQFLRESETITFEYELQVQDDSGEANDTALATVTVTINGVNDQPDLTLTPATGSLTEDSGPDPLTASGSVSITDDDTNDTQTLSFNNASATRSGSTALTAAQAAALTSGISVSNANNTWNYSVANSAVQFLNTGETATVTFDVVVTDDSGAANDSDFRTVTITINGVDEVAGNNQPTITADDGSVTEDDSNPNLTDTGNITVGDADAGDTLTVSSSFASNSGTTLTAAQLAALNGGFNATNTGWTFTVANSAVQFLGAGEIVTLTYNVTVDDNTGASNATATDQVTININGVNDQPNLILNSASGSVTEDTGNPLTASGSLSISDVDQNDNLSVSVSNVSQVRSGGGTLTATQIAQLTQGFSADSNSWDYSVPNSAVQFLDSGETVTLTFNVIANDNSGAANATDTETVTIVINGVDEPTAIGTVSGTLFLDEATNPDRAIGVDPIFNFQKDAGESGLGGIKVRLVSSTGEVRTTTTTLQGTYSFVNVPSGSYTVSYDVDSSRLTFLGQSSGVVNVGSGVNSDVTGPALNAIGYAGALSNLDILSSNYDDGGTGGTASPRAGGIVSLDDNGNQRMFVVDPNWAGVQFAELALNEARDSALLTII
ncbi:MAG: hypothetical protein HKN47_06655, partial [Pirellulaceae bacterium]|nr:hypothetical protein [Pirellulaceae bacterium]